MSKFRIIPYNSIGRQNGLMLGFKADKVKIIIDDEEKEVNNAIIGIFNESLIVIHIQHLLVQKFYKQKGMIVR